MKILVVDDELDTPLLFNHEFRREIKEKRLTFEFVFSAEEAIGYLKTPESTDVILILSDINMPGMNGIELLRLIKTEYPHITIFMITAFADNNNYTKCQRYGADHFINKPINFAELRKSIEAIS